MLQFLIKTLFLFLLIYSGGSLNAQGIELTVLAEEDSLAVEKANVFSDNSFIGETDKNGKIKIDSGFKNIKVTHVSFVTLEIDNQMLKNNRIIYLTSSQYELDEIIFNEKNSGNISTVNFGWNDKAATFISHKNDNVIQKLKFRVRDFSGVKGLKYLPFKANLYSVGSDGKPDVPLITNDVLVENKKGKSWAEVDISQYKLKVPKEGVYVVFIIPEREFYKVGLIQAKIGVISAVPLLKRSLRKSRKYSYRLEYSSDCECDIWLYEKYKYFMMDVELEE